MSGIECAFTGFLPREPEGLRTSQAGKPWLSFGVGVGEGDDKMWLRIAAFDEIAQEIAPLLHKGGCVYIEGRLSQSEWRGKDGQPKRGLNVAAFRVVVLNQIGRNRPRKAKGRAPGPASRSNTDNTSPTSGLNDDVPW